MRRVGADEYSALRGKQIETAIWRYSTWIDENTDRCRAFYVPKGEHTSLEMTVLNESSGVNVLKEFSFSYYQKYCSLFLIISE